MWYSRLMDDDLVMAREHVRRGREIIVSQERLIERQKALHLNTTESEYTLSLFCITLKIFEDHYFALAVQAESLR